MEILSLLHVDPLQANIAVREHSEGDIWRKCPDLFMAISLLKDDQLKLHVDESVKLVAHPVCRILFGLHENVDKKLDGLRSRP